MTSPRFLAFAGSARKDSLNKKLVGQLAAAAGAAGATVTLLDLRDYSMPLYDGDLEQQSGVPHAALALCREFALHEGLLFASPEYNKFISPLTKNTFDWISRIKEVEGQPSGLAVLSGKVVGLVSASPGAFGGMRSLTLATQLLHGLGMMVVPEQFALGAAHAAFNDDGTLKEAKHQQQIDRVARAVLNMADALKLKGAQP
jgi:chromate reductase, NAD(P)H dehydrogenase (quinone)